MIPIRFETCQQLGTDKLYNFTYSNVYNNRNAQLVANVHANKCSHCLLQVVGTSLEKAVGLSDLLWGLPEIWDISRPRDFKRLFAW